MNAQQKFEEMGFELPLQKRESARIMRSFPNSCLTCKFSKLWDKQGSPENSFCNKFKEIVNHFNDGGNCHETGTKLKALKRASLIHLLNSPLFDDHKPTV